MKFRQVLIALTLVLMISATVFGQKRKPLAENFSTVTMDGQTVELDSLKGKVVVMTFWSTRCAICVAEIPKLNQIAGNYKEKDVVFLGLTTDNPTLVENFLKNRPFNFNILPDSFGVLLKYADRDRAGNLNMGFPAYFVVNQKGEIEMKASGWNKIDALDQQISRLLISQPQKAE